MRTTEVGTAMLAMAILLAAPAAASGQVDCGLGEGRTHGRVLAPTGTGHAGAVVEVAGTACGMVTDTVGRFSFSGLPGPEALIKPGVLGYCIVPRWVDTSASAEVVFQTVRARNPLDDTFVAVHGTPWLPANYEQSRCRQAASIAGSEGAEAPDRPETPDPGEVLTLLMELPAVHQLLEAVTSKREQVPVALIYGEVEGPLPIAPSPYRLDPSGFGEGIYILVLFADAGSLRVQVGRPYQIDTERGSLGAESGFIVEWQRTGEEWGDASIVERWLR